MSKGVKEYILLSPEDLIVEPSAGNGAFISGIKALTNNYRFYDIEPDNDEIISKIIYNTTMVLLRATLVKYT